ncbi:MAG: glycosyltransferase [Lachnospiraceae bacterium]|nr:glycosyltransferase [Lachnospiraceae bacterium]
MNTIDVIIPTYKPGKELTELIRTLFNMVDPVDTVRIINTDEALFDPGLVSEFGSRVRVRHIPQSEFDHGYARDLGARESKADFLMFMTQDAMPCEKDRTLTRKLTAPMKVDPTVAAVYARQIPYKNCNRTERLTRNYNYPPIASVKSADDLPRLGVKTYFCSNVCAAYRRDIYLKLGGFEHGAIFNEDMVFAAKLIHAGYRIAYDPLACVRHSHNYSLMQYFRRSFDMAVSQTEHPEVFAAVSSEKEGAGMVKTVSKQMLRRKWFFSFLFFFASCVAKYAGYFLGKRYKKLPKKLVRFCTASNWWFSRRESAE